MEELTYTVLSHDVMRFNMTSAW